MCSTLQSFSEPSVQFQNKNIFSVTQQLSMYQTHFPDFVTRLDRDPFNLRFKSQHLDVGHDLFPIRGEQKDTSVERFITHKPAEKKWDSRLILPKESWPHKSAAYTRYKRRQCSYSGFMHRVSEKLSKIWETEAELSKSKEQGNGKLEAF
nr:PREDICTED: uncharacterized protein LOC106706875 isoform X2 [Latimeria chalumnae]|eukprot:XP_014353894.1 PREDICTED: uncharacterized protein LOC106706875 isoform X2 [Latimeria chalumnae]